MNREDTFTDLLAERLSPLLLPHRLARKQSLLYDLSFNDLGVVTMGVDEDSGQPLRGSGRGFEQDILIYDESDKGHTSVVPRVVLEVKVGSVSTHDAIVYSEKADRIRRVYPYVRYGFVLAGLNNIPGRVLRLGQRFDFIIAIPEELPDAELKAFGGMLNEEVVASLRTSAMLFGKLKPRSVRKAFVVE